MKTSRKVMNLLEDRTRFLHCRATVQIACVYPIGVYYMCEQEMWSKQQLLYEYTCISISLIMCKSSELFEIVKVCDEAFRF